MEIISKLNRLDFSDDVIKNMTYQERCNTLDKNPVLVARHFQYKVEIFFKVIVFDGPLGKTRYYAIRVGFQVRGSPDIHSFIWILNGPKLSKETKDEYIQWVDSIIRTDIANSVSEKELFEFVKTFQVHRHSKKCRKYRNDKCRFNFGKFFTDKTIVAESIPEDMPEEIKNQVLKNRSDLLSKVKRYIDTELNPSKKNIYDSTRSGNEVVKTIEEILSLLEISKEDYETALSISEDSDYQLYLKRPPNSRFVSNYFTDGLLAWEANIDIQPVFNHYKAVAYMCAYLSKSEDECSQAMNQAVKEAFEDKLDNYQQMKSVAQTYINKRECSIQECLYQVLSGKWLRKTFPGVIFANFNIPEKRYRICRKEKDIARGFKRHFQNEYD